MSEATKGYKELIVWQKAMTLTPQVYRLAKQLPKEETYALADQIRRAVVSIPANIAEGQARQHRKEFLQHLSIAKGSLAELDTLLLIARSLGYLKAEELQRIEPLMTEVRRLLQGLMQHLRQKTD